MIQDPRAKGREFARFLESLHEEQRIHVNELDRRAAEAEYQEFLKTFCNRFLLSLREAACFFQQEVPLLALVVKAQRI